MSDKTINTIEDARTRLEEINLEQGLNGTVETKGEAGFTGAFLSWTEQTGIKKSIVAARFPTADWYLGVNGWKDQPNCGLWNHQNITVQPSLSPADLSGAFDTVARWSEDDLSYTIAYEEHPRPSEITLDVQAP
jgi:hypothetical protein